MYKLSLSLSLSLSLFLLIFSVSCQTIHYTNKSEIPHHYTYSKWHHIGILGLMEFSPPVNVKETCGQRDWKAVRTQKNFLQALVSGAIAGALNMVYNGLGSLGLYTPEEVSVACNNS